MRQLDLLPDVFGAYADSRTSELTNDDLYRAVAQAKGVPVSEFLRPTTIGRARTKHSKPARTVRWAQQTLKRQGILERVPGHRGRWRLSADGKRLSMATRPHTIVGFSTRLGVALWADLRDAARHIEGPVHLYLSSPPYPLAKPRAYGNPTREEYVDFICECLEPVLPKLAAGASIALNISNDIFCQGLPSRELFRQRLTIALADRFGLHLADELIWHNPSKPTGPVQWASKTRQQLHYGYETVLWMTNDPEKLRSNNNRVLEPHTERHRKLLSAGGDANHRRSSDGAHCIRPGSYSHQTAGRIPRNVLRMGHSCASQREYKAASQALGLPAHGAPFPVRLAEFLIKFLTQPGDLVVDGMAGSCTTGVAAESLKRRWVCVDAMAEYIRGAATRFVSGETWVNPHLHAPLDVQSA